MGTKTNVHTACTYNKHAHRHIPTYTPMPILYKAGIHVHVKHTYICTTHAYMQHVYVYI